jgi:hypothetical protein
MSYIDDHLLPGERIIYRTRSHWILLGWPILFVTTGIIGAIALYLEFRAEYYWIAGAVVAAVGLVIAVGPLLRYMSADFAVTDKRVLAKFGLVRRHSLETLLSKVEAIGVDQDVPGRLFGYGTITIIGTGGTQEVLPMIAAPLEFRRQVQTQIVALEALGRGGAARILPNPTPAAAPPPPASPPRLERECPHCAERILVKAKVCKHCGLDVA